MSVRITATGAWDLLRAAANAVASVSAESSGQATTVTVDGASLTVEPTGAWTTSAPSDPEATHLLDLFAPIAAAPGIVVGQVGQSLDGRIATESGDSHYVTGPGDIERLHRLRALVDAVVVGAGTAVSDDPRLTTRRAPGENPLRVVLDPAGRVEPSGHLFRDGAAPTLWVRHGVPESPTPDHVEIMAPREPDPGVIAPSWLLEMLEARGCRRVLVEGGGVTVSHFLAARALDRLHVTVAPMVIGSGRPSLSLAPVATLADALRPACRHFTLGDDVLFDLDLRRVSGSRGAA
ncbi:MAG: RibD family protein [Gemmatimonadota bacterium]|nr:RibD family protein [Gemmatimonadota bacterium]